MMYIQIWLKSNIVHIFSSESWSGTVHLSLQLTESDFISPIMANLSQADLAITRDSHKLEDISWIR